MISATHAFIWTSAILPILFLLSISRFTALWLKMFHMTLIVWNLLRLFIAQKSHFCKCSMCAGSTHSWRVLCIQEGKLGNCFTNHSFPYWDFHICLSIPSFTSLSMLNVLILYGSYDFSDDECLRLESCYFTNDVSHALCDFKYVNSSLWNLTCKNSLRTWLKSENPPEKICTVL